MSAAAWPDIGEILEVTKVVRLPLRVRFRGLDHREAVLMRGPQGWSEFAPFVEYDDREAAWWLAAGLEAGWGSVPPPVRDWVSVNATVPAVSAKQVAPILARFAGCQTAKVKVAQAGQRLSDDIARVSAVRDVLGPEAAIRVDANAAWDLDQATDAITRLSAYDLEYAEQPVAEVDDLARLRVRLAAVGISVPIAADESIRRAADPMEVARKEAADVIVVKVAPLGGVARVLEVVDDCGLPAVVSSALDTSVGISAGLALACALPDLSHACGLGTVTLLARDVAPEPLLPVDGALTRAQARSSLASIGVLGSNVLADAERTRWWRDRLSRCWSLL
ncbi:MAG: o-succinylbenzoate synthase [Ornithinimicrobium sp.]